MAHTLAHADRAFLEDRRTAAAPAYQAFRLLQVAFIIAQLGAVVFGHMLDVLEHFTALRATVLVGRHGAAPSEGRSELGSRSATC